MCSSSGVQSRLSACCSRYIEANRVANRRFLKIVLATGRELRYIIPAHSRTLDRAFSSGGERFPDTEEARSSNLLTPTKCSQLRGFASELFCFTPPSQKDAAAPKPLCSSNNHPRRGRCRLDGAGKHPNSAQSRPTALAIASIRPRCGPRSRIRTARKSKVNGFPRSERAKMNPPEHRHFWRLISCGFVVRILRFWRQKVWMLRGSKNTRSLHGKPFTFNTAAPLRRQRPTYQC